jgi:hypothetical protein
MRIARAARLIASLGCLGWLAAPSAGAADATINVYESTFNNFANALKPLTITGHYKFRVTVDLGILGRHGLTICDSDWTATVTSLSFHISPGGVNVDGGVDVSWCHISFSSSQLGGSGNVYYSTVDHAVHFSFSSASVQPCFSIGGWDVCLPISISVNPTLNIPSLPIRPSLVHFETASGPKQLRLDPTNVSLTKQSGYVQLRSDAHIW